MKDMYLKKALISVILLLVALLSVFFVSDWASSPETYEKTIASIDENVDNVMKLTAASTIASAGISAIPGDTATPIAEKLADFTEYFMLVLCVLYAEKYLLTVIGVAAFKILIPIACAFLVIGQFADKRRMNVLAKKFVVFALVAFITVPCSLKVAEFINETYQTSIDSTITAAQEFSDETAELSDAEDKGVIESIMDRLSETTSTLSDKAARILNSFIESLAVLIVTSCIIPLLMLIFSIWVLKMLTGLDIHVPSMPYPRKFKASRMAKPKM